MKWKLECRIVTCDGSSSASCEVLVNMSADHITVDSSGQSSVYFCVHCHTWIIIKRNESTTRPRERHLAVSVVPPMPQRGTCCHLSPTDQCLDHWPPMLAHPPTNTLTTCRIDTHVWYWPVDVVRVWWTHPVVAACTKKPHTVSHIQRGGSLSCWHTSSLLKPKFHLARHVSTRDDTFDVSSASRRAYRSVLFDKLDTTKMHGFDTSNVSCRDVSRRSKWNVGLI